MKRIRFGEPEKLVPSYFCKNFSYRESDVSYPVSRFEAKETSRGFLVEFPIDADTKIYGLGLQLKQFSHFGKKLRLAVNADPVSPNGDSNAPVPFFVTNKGYGMYFDTARYIEVYCGYEKVRSDGKSETIMSVLVPAAHGIDVYVIEGSTITDIVSQYNMLSGGGPAVPEWGLGVFYRCGGRFSERDVLDTADYFRKKDIPCDILGLEPGWQSHAYPCSFAWSESFPDPDGMIKKLRESGFHINLWEHAFCHPSSPLYPEISRHSGNYRVWGGAVPDFSSDEARSAFADYHREKFVESGIDGFKLDECDSSDNTGGWSFPLTSAFPSGLDGEQYHSLFGVLYCQTIMNALGGRGTLSEVRSMGALATGYPFVLYSDLYDHRDFIRGVAQSGFSGLLWAPEVRECHDRDELIRRLQTVVFSVQCLINAWYIDTTPWSELDCEDEVRELLRLRETLVPTLKKSFDIYHETGKPPVRALVMDYTDDPETFVIDDEYMFCEDILVAPVAAGCGDERDVYLPVADEWEDYFTGEPVGNGHIRVSTKGIPVYRKSLRPSAF
ncbi:MAG: TIM-barrel domain-containing protein [Eubacteriales bacterium]